MVNVGCKFLMNDLTPQEWDELITLAIERQWMDERVRKQQEDRQQEIQSVDKIADEGRRELGIPPPGGSIFPRSAPIR